MKDKLKSVSEATNNLAKNDVFVKAMESANSELQW